jgi:hypothetical protein
VEAGVTYEEEVDYLISTPADRVAGFALTLNPSAREAAYPIEIRYELRCKSCGGDAFRFFCFPLVAPDPSPYFGIEPGQAIARPPHAAQCVDCQARASVFDGRTDGYNGRLNSFFAYESGETGEDAFPGIYRLMVTLVYNIDVDELMELGSNASVSAPDLYDWIGIECVPVGEGDSFALDYKCG